MQSEYISGKAFNFIMHLWLFLRSFYSADQVESAYHGISYVMVDQTVPMLPTKNALLKKILMRHVQVNHFSVTKVSVA